MERSELVISPPVADRYTLDGNAAVEGRIARDQALVAEAVTAIVRPPVLCALVLMGGYGRGEGGHLWRGASPEPYNDYDYFVVVRGLDRPGREAVSRTLGQAAKALEHQVGVEVDFALLRQERLPTAEYSLMNAEMRWGHRVVTGDPDVLAAMPPMPFSGLSPGEFTRLLLNRGSLLLMNQQRLGAARSPSPAEREVFFKYLFKAILACGDARLAGNRRYHPSYLKKLELLGAMDWPEQGPFMAVYRHAWDHKFHPDYGRFAGEDLAAWQGRVVHLWLATLVWFERRRTGLGIEDWETYASPAVPKGQGGRSWGGLRNAAITLRDFGLGELLRRPRWSLRYPRERLIAALPLLLHKPGAALPAVASRALVLPGGASWSEAAETFLRLWRRYA